MANLITTPIVYSISVVALVYMLLTLRLSRRKVCKLLATACIAHIVIFYTFFIFFGGYPVITPTINGWSSGLRVHSIITFVLMTSNFAKVS
jgi:TRAP-type C4-dicarboxylate transport system permease small subunit